MDKNFDRDKFIKEFENMRDMSELKALSKYSLETPLNAKQYKRMMELTRLTGIKI